MKLTKTCPIDKKVYVMDIPMTQTEYDHAVEKWQAGTLIQNAFPTLNAGLREFIKTGIPPQVWDKMF